MSLLKRTMDAAFLNGVVNDPEVRPWLGGEGQIDLGPIAANSLNIVMVGEHGGFVGFRQEPSILEVHSQVLPSGRGGWALAAVEEALRYVFTHTEVETITTKAPEDNKGAILLARHAGFQEVFRLADGPICFSLTFDRWRGRDKTLAEVGQTFHAELEAAKEAWGSDQPSHPDDEAHDRAAGAAVLMLRAGNPGRAVVSYNRWAALAGYDSIALRTVVPIVLDIGDAVVTCENGEMEVLSIARDKGA